MSCWLSEFIRLIETDTGCDVTGIRPFLDQSIADGEEGRTDEDADEPKGQRTAQYAKQDQYQRHIASWADEPRLDEIINRADSHSPNEHKYAPPRGTLMEEPKGRREHNERRPHR